MTIRIILADDHPIFREGLVNSIEETGEFEVVGVGGSADEAVALAFQYKPDIALLDLSMPGNGITAAQRISDAGSAGAIAMLTVSEDSNDVTAAMQAGAMGYLLKGVSASELREVLGKIARGEAHVSPGLAAQMLRVMQNETKPPRQPIDELTKREEDILRGVAVGKSNKEIGSELNIQEKTVKHYMTIILGKLQARNRVEAALIAQEAWGKSQS
ncbi:LuxR family two component transcriptional regulator [Loktanella sp. PT4BL]|jgi:DNA-binding NarL/FixJ family response regulator|uniref:response regulator n=1 Tax=Loktanella sp. PT4BL TaxID=2135611 RepID=UPI000D752AC5|nr:response regulator transcription factor [Loktanella sp. PT4BL]PXW72841.1 LuxR family two component transcriptional regulator [Loktanella sp. PT4BL]